MVNKKGYIKTIESVIAIIIIITVSFAIIPQYLDKPPEPPLNVQDSMNYINQKVENDDYVRDTLVPWDGSSYPSTWPRNEFGTIPDGQHPIEDYLTSLVEQGVPPLYDFACAACATPHLCIVNTPIDRNVYPTEVFIASGGGEQDPKLVRVWLWERLTGTDRETYSTANSRYYNK